MPGTRVSVWLAVWWVAFAGGCVRLDRSDAFPVGSAPMSLPALQALAGGDVRVERLDAVADGRHVAAYYVGHAGARGVMILFGGSGNEIAAPVKVMSGRARALGLDLVVFSYYRLGESVPSVAQVRAEARAVYGAAAAAHPVAARSVYLVGYSLGGWFATDVATAEPAAGLVLVGAETTPAAVIRATYAPWASFVAIVPDGDGRQLDAGLYAPRVRVPTLVVTSVRDADVPAAVGRAVYGMLPAGTRSRLVVLDGPTHGRYFLDDALWGAMGGFFGLPAR